MSAFKVTPETTEHALTMLGTVAIAAEQLRAALTHKDARIAALEAEATDWMKCARANQDMLNIIGRQMGGRIPEQLVTEIARERMDRIAELEGAIDKLAQCKGRYHTEANFKALIAVREKKVAS